MARTDVMEQAEYDCWQGLKTASRNMSTFTANYGKVSGGVEDIYSKIEEPTNDAKKVKESAIVGLHKRTRPKKAFLFIFMVTWNDGSHVTIYRKLSEIRKFHIALDKEMGQDGVAKEAKYYLMKRRRKIIRGSMRPSSGTIKYLRMIDELNIYFQVFIYYLRLTQDLEATKAFFKLSSEDLNASNWSKSGKTYFYVINSIMTQHKVTIEDCERTKREKHDDIRATLSRVPSKALPLVARRNCETRQQGAASKHQHIYVAMENHAPCDVERRHNIIELRAGEKVEILARSKTGWWFVKRLESCENSYGYVPAAFLTEEYSAITSSKRHNENEASSGKRLRAMTSPDVWALKAVKGHPGAASRPDRQAERNDYVTTRAYIAQNDDELSFGEDVILQVIDKKDDGWWLARYKNNEGLVPGIFLKKFNDPIRKLSLEIFNIR